jgi:hypothetical protein
LHRPIRRRSFRQLISEAAALVALVVVAVSVPPLINGLLQFRHTIANLIINYIHTHTPQAKRIE